jgi:hypothetical protein
MGLHVSLLLLWYMRDSFQDFDWSVEQISRDTPDSGIMDLRSKTDKRAFTVPFLPQQVWEGRGNGRVAPPESFASRVSSLLQHACMCVCG